MFEEFGAQQGHDDVGGLSKTMEFKLFLPKLKLLCGGEVGHPSQCRWGGDPEIAKVEAVGSFQEQPWDLQHGVELSKSTGPGEGTLFQGKVTGLAPGFYSYRYLVTFNDRTQRLVADPCAHYTAARTDESAAPCGFVIDDPATYKESEHEVTDLKGGRVPPGDLIIYELMLDDFSKELRGTKAPVAAVDDAQLERIRELGFNAIEFMPWTAWPDDNFSWGYDPYLFFAPSYRYVNDSAQPTVKLDALKALVSRCHDKGIAVIMDGVFNHASESRKARGFPYYWLYRHHEDCPFTGPFQGGGYFQDLDYENPCCNTFISDVCRYWMNEFKIDGIRLDYTLGFYDPSRPGIGLPKLIQDVRTCANDSNFYVAIEHLTDNRYAAIEICNKVGATSNWFDSWHFVCRDGLLNKRRDDRKNTPVDGELMRIVNAQMDYDEKQGCWPTRYMATHDESDPCSYGEGQGKWWRVQPWTILLYTGPGPILLYNGHEFADDAYVPDSGPDRVSPRPLRWAEKRDTITGQKMESLCRGLARIRSAHRALRSRNVYPTFDAYDKSRDDWLEHFVFPRGPDNGGYGLEKTAGVLVFHRWASEQGGHRFIVALNFSDTEWSGWIPFSGDGNWVDLDLFDSDDTGTKGSVQPVADGRAWVTLSPNWGRVFLSPA